MIFAILLTTSNCSILLRCCLFQWPTNGVVVIFKSWAFYNCNKEIGLHTTDWLSRLKTRLFCYTEVLTMSLLGRCHHLFLVAVASVLAWTPHQTFICSLRNIPGDMLCQSHMSWTGKVAGWFLGVRSILKLSIEWVDVTNLFHNGLPNLLYHCDAMLNSFPIVKSFRGISSIFSVSSLF